MFYKNAISVAALIAHNWVVLVMTLLVAVKVNLMEAMWPWPYGSYVTLTLTHKVIKTWFMKSLSTDAEYTATIEISLIHWVGVVPDFIYIDKLM